MKKIVLASIIATTLLVNIAQAISCPKILRGARAGNITADGLVWVLLLSDTRVNKDINWPNTSDDIITSNYNDQYFYDAGNNDLGDTPSCAYIDLKETRRLHKTVYTKLALLTGSGSATHYICKTNLPPEAGGCATNFFIPDMKKKK